MCVIRIFYEIKYRRCLFWVMMNGMSEFEMKNLKGDWFIFLRFKKYNLVL